MRSNAEYVLQNHHLRPPLRIHALQADHMKEVIQQTDRGKGEFPQQECSRQRYAHDHLVVCGKVLI